MHFLKRIIECPWIENWAENQFLCLMQKRKMHLLRKLHLDVFHERKLHLYFSRYSRYLLLLPLGFNRLKSEKINMASLQCLYLLVACSLDKIVYVKKTFISKKINRKTYLLGFRVCTFLICGFNDQISGSTQICFLLMHSFVGVF